jgi:hypothetical protein
LFDEHKANKLTPEEGLKHRGKHIHESPFVTHEDNFNYTSNSNQYKRGPGGEAQEVQSNSHVDLRGGDG